MTDNRSVLVVRTESQAADTLLRVEKGVAIRCMRLQLETNR
jgi:hypothetical protein